jgi:hypothetical protein
MEYFLIGFSAFWGVAFGAALLLALIIAILNTVPKRKR